MRYTLHKASGDGWALVPEDGSLIMRPEQMHVFESIASMVKHLPKILGPDTAGRIIAHLPRTEKGTFAKHVQIDAE